MSTARILYEHINDVERLDLYRPGGYHPIIIVDCLRQRYRVVQKLGYGTYSTIWLARDEQLSKYVAVKVGTADSDENEVDILSRIAAADALETPGRAFLPTVLDRFTLDGPNGTHVCLVTSPARCSLADTKEASSSGLFQLAVARSLAAQLAVAVAYIHDLGYVHGDLHLGNMLLRLTSAIDQLSVKQLHEKFGKPDPETVFRADGKPLGEGVPSHVFSPVWLGEASESVSLSDAKLLLADFGVAFCPVQVVRFESCVPLEIRAPEARFEPTSPLSFASDIWSLACTIWAILGQRSLLDSFLITQDDATADQVDFLGPLPPEWQKKWEVPRKKFDENGRPALGRSVWSWDQRFEDSIQEPRRSKGMETMSNEERTVLFEMLRGMLAFRPGDRLVAKQVLKTEWMRNWAIPASEKTWK
ncbi:hypothetical protein EsH8_V_001134 [Colletotrichum jinshuiense]